MQLDINRFEDVFEFPLNQYEKDLIRSVAKGEWDVCPTALEGQEIPKIRAELIRHLLFELPLKDGNPWPIQSSGIQLCNAKITGSLNLKYGRRPNGAPLSNLELVGCEFEELIDISHAHIIGISFSNSEFKMLLAEGLIVDGNFILKNTIAGIAIYKNMNDSDILPSIINLSQSIIGGVLDISDSDIQGHINVIDLSLARVASDIYIIDSNLVSNFSYSNAIYNSNAVYAHSIKVGGSFIFVDYNNIYKEKLEDNNVGKTKILGNIDLFNAEINGNLAISGLSGLKNTVNNFVPIFDFRKMNVGGDFNLKFSNINNCRIIINKIKIGGSSNLNFLELNKESHISLHADNIFINNDFNLSLYIFTNFDIKISSSKISGKLSNSIFNNTKNKTINIESYNDIKQKFTFTYDNIECGILSNNFPKVIKSKIFFNINGFYYKLIDLKDIKPNIFIKNWLFYLKNKIKNENKVITPQVYIHLSHVLSNMGYQKESNDVLVMWEKKQILPKYDSVESLLTYLLSLIFITPFKFLFGLFFQFGYSPIRAAMTFTALIISGWAMVYFALQNDLMVRYVLPSATVTNEKSATDFRVPGSSAIGVSQIPCGGSISPLWYAVDTAIPLIDLRQESECIPEVIGQAKPMTLFGYQMPSITNEVLRWIKSVYALLGAFVTSLAILTFSGVIKKNKEA